MPSIVINIEGDYDEEQINKAMIILGELVINKVKQYVRDMDLIESGAFLQGWFSNWDGHTLTIENTQEYALYLEYGTYGYFKQFGEDNFPDPSHPKKKDIEVSLRKQFPSGVQPFSPVRRVLYNEAILSDLVSKAFNNV